METPAETVQSVRYECDSCGGTMRFEPAKNALQCPYCRTVREISPAAAEAITRSLAETPLEDGMARAPRGLGAETRKIHCNDCGANVNVEPKAATARCPFCDSQVVIVEPADASLIRPEALVPFVVDKSRAESAFKDWVKGGWFRPSALQSRAQLAQIDGVYVPFWTFDARVHSDWQAERGHHVRVQKMAEVEENGQRVMKQIEETETRWEPAWGARDDVFDDLPVCASTGLPANLARSLARIEVGQLKPYRPEYLAGWQAESYGVSLEDGWKQARGTIDGQQESRCGGDVGGDTHRGLQVRNTYQGITFRHVLAPVWVAAYRYDGKVYRFLVDGRSGKVSGESPTSWLKVLALVAVIVAVIAALVLFGRSKGQGAPKVGAGPQDVPALHAPPSIRPAMERVSGNSERQSAPSPCTKVPGSQQMEAAALRRAPLLGGAPMRASGQLPPRSARTLRQPTERRT